VEFAAKVKETEESPGFTTRLVKFEESAEIPVVTIDPV
jgi:hypothetical protein